MVEAFRAYIAYLVIEMRLSHQKIAEHLATVFEYLDQSVDVA